MSPKCICTALYKYNVINSGIITYILSYFACVVSVYFIVQRYLLRNKHRADSVYSTRFR